MRALLSLRFIRSALSLMCAQPYNDNGLFNSTEFSGHGAVLRVVIDIDSKSFQIISGRLYTSYSVSQ